jgi:E3 ubiquitin-protein ligase synoviolin
MDERYPDATEEEVGRLGGGSCVICREEMVAKETRERAAASEGETAGRREGPNETPKKLACGHVFHFHCLRSWLER